MSTAFANPIDEAREDLRLAALRSYAVMDTPPEREFDDIVSIAAHICGVPMAIISLIDDERTWAKSGVGIDFTELPREATFCWHVIDQPDVFIIRDALQDPRFADHPFVEGEPKLRFYAGVPITSPSGFALGSLCVLDKVTRDLSPEQTSALVALARQVTTMLELRRMSVLQRTSEARHRFILESALDYGIVTMDLQGFVTSWNEGAHRILGWTEDEMCGRPCTDFFTPEDRAANIPAKEMNNALLKGHALDERWHLRKNGDRFWASGEMMPLMNDDDVLIGFLKILRDRTEQQLAALAVRQSETRMRLTLEAVDLGAWQVNAALDQFTWDDRTRELLAHDPDECIDYDATFLSRVHADDRRTVDAAVQSAFGVDGTGQLKINFRTVNPHDGRVRWVELHGGPIDSFDNSAGFVGTVRDITPEKDAEAHRAVLTNELEHRVGNTLAIVQAVVSQSLRNVAIPFEVSQTIDARLASLGRAHKLLTQTSWKAAPMRQVIQGAAGVTLNRAEHIRLSGPDIDLNARAALALAMVVHELSTNAVKYGALSNDDGIVDLHWMIEGDRPDAIFELTWWETGGPTVVAPTHRGFGSDLIETILASDLGGTCVLDYLPAGVKWTLRAKLSLIEQQT